MEGAIVIYIYKDRIWTCYMHLNLNPLKPVSDAWGVSYVSFFLLNLDLLVVYKTLASFPNVNQYRKNYQHRWMAGCNTVGWVSVPPIGFIMISVKCALVFRSIFFAFFLFNVGSSSETDYPDTTRWLNLMLSIWMAMQTIFYKFFISVS